MIDYNTLIWESNCNGYEIGRDEIAVVGIYTEKMTDRMVLIDAATDEIIKDYE